ncbi:MAG: L-seryl-tRNA(Sec) selenium transferase [bacterium]
MPSGELHNSKESSLKKVVNATGIVIHTNLGRSILSKSAIEHLIWACGNYVNIEYDIESGQRSHRDKITEGLLKELTGCEASIVVNNNAAAVLLCLNTFAKDREVIVSRGELIEIGGSFRIPDVMQSSGAILREIGTTNRTYLKDYQNAINEKTAILLKVHTSNYKIEGSTNSPDTSEIVSLGKKMGIIVMEDLGSGAMIDLSKYGLPKEPVVRESIESGVDIVTFSGDKLLGGPQAGIILGKQNIISSIRKNPLTRCVRIDKMTVSALEATLRLYIEGREKDVPTIAYLTRSNEEIKKIAELVSSELSVILDGIAEVTMENGFSQVGSGSLPGQSIKTFCVAVKPKNTSVDILSALFRHNEVPIIGRTYENKFIMDMRTVYEEDIKYIMSTGEHVRLALRS